MYTLYVICLESPQLGDRKVTPYVKALAKEIGNLEERKYTPTTYRSLQKIVFGALASLSNSTFNRFSLQDLFVLEELLEAMLVVDYEVTSRFNEDVMNFKAMLKWYKKIISQIEAKTQNRIKNNKTKPA